MYTMCTALLTVGNTSQSERWREEGGEWRRWREREGGVEGSRGGGGRERVEWRGVEREARIGR